MKLSISSGLNKLCTLPSMTSWQLEQAKIAQVSGGFWPIPAMFARRICAKTVVELSKLQTPSILQKHG